MTSGQVPAVGRGRALLLRAILVALPFVALIGIEVCARVIFSLRFGVPGHVYGTFKYDPVLGVVPKENSYSRNAHLNDYGFRNSENVLMPKPADGLRVIAYGGSTTYCHQLQNDEAWPIRLQETMRQSSGKRDQVLNGGVIMWSLGHSFEKAKRDVPKLAPDVVIIYTGVNERYNAAGLEQQGVSMRDLVARHDYGRFTTALALNSPFRDIVSYKALRDEVIGPLQAMWHTSPQPAGELSSNGNVDADIMTNYLETLHRFVTYLKDHGVKPVYVKEVFDPANPRAPFLKELTAFSAKAATVASDWGAVVVDPTLAFRSAERPDMLFQESGVHLTAAGANLMASVVYAQAFKK